MTISLSKNAGKGPLAAMTAKLLPVVLLAALSSPAQSANLSFTGNFAMDDGLAFFSFHLNATSTVTIRTYGYAGGTNDAAQIIAAGGFDPVITLFDGTTGNYLTENNDGNCPAVNPDPVGGACWDSYLQLVGLTAGDYTLVLSQAPNVHGGTVVTDPFPLDGQGNFTGPMFGTGSESFLDAFSRQRTSAWALDILNVDSASLVGVPEPASVFLLGSASLALLFLRRRR